MAMATPGALLEEDVSPRTPMRSPELPRGGSLRAGPADGDGRNAATPDAATLTWTAPPPTPTLWRHVAAQLGIHADDAVDTHASVRWQRVVDVMRVPPALEQVWPPLVSCARPRWPSLTQRVRPLARLSLCGSAGPCAWTCCWPCSPLRRCVPSWQSGPCCAPRCTSMLGPPPEPALLSHLEPVAGNARRGPAAHRASAVNDLLRVLVFAAACQLVLQVDLSWLYHFVRGQTSLKLYVIFNVLEVGEQPTVATPVAAPPVATHVATQSPRALLPTARPPRPAL